MFYSYSTLQQCRLGCSCYVLQSSEFCHAMQNWQYCPNFHRIQWFSPQILDFYVLLCIICTFPPTYLFTPVGILVGHVSFLYNRRHPTAICINGITSAKALCKISQNFLAELRGPYCTQCTFTVSQKNRTPGIFSNISNKSGPISIIFGTDNGQ